MSESCKNCVHCHSQTEEADMTDKEVRILASAIEEFGAENQPVVAIEEMTELQKEICKTLRNGYKSDGMAEEFADVIIMLNQIELMFPSIVNEALLWREKKLKRLMRIIEGGSNE